MAKNRLFALYGTWEGLVWCKILPRGVGTICPYFWEIWLSTTNVHFFEYYYCVLKPLLSSMFEAKSYRQNDRTDHGIISWFSWKSDFDIVFTSQIHDFHAKPTFSIVCIMNIFVCMRYIYTNTIEICIRRPFRATRLWSMSLQQVAYSPCKLVACSLVVPVILQSCSLVACKLPCSFLVCLQIGCC